MATYRCPPICSNPRKNSFPGVVWIAEVGSTAAEYGTGIEEKGYMYSICLGKPDSLAVTMDPETSPGTASGGGGPWTYIGVFS